VHECFIGATFSNSSSATWTKERDIVALRNAMAMSGYYRLERDSRSGRFISMASGDDIQYLPFVFDFYAMDRQFMDAVSDSNNWSPDLISRTFYETCSRIWSQYPGSAEDYSLAVTMENNVDGMLNLIENGAISMKLVWVDRPAESILATHCKRRPFCGIVGSHAWGTKSAQDFIATGEVARLERKRMRIERLAARHPDQVMIAPLREIVEETESVMPKIAEFLGIGFSDELLAFTYCGRSHEGSDRYLGKLNDVPEGIFSQAELGAIEKEVHRVRTLTTRDSFVQKVRRKLGHILIGGSAQQKAF
jgi:hypothetical protein